MKKINKNILIFFFIFIVIIGKVTRYTVMKKSLVDTGIGHYMVDDVYDRKINFGFTYDVKNTEDTVSATDNALSVFALINILELDTYEKIEIYISIIWNIILILLLFKLKSRLNVFEGLFVVMSIAVLNIFDFCLAKEPVQMLYFILMFYLLLKIKNTKIKYIVTIAVVLLSAITFRVYYFLIIIFMIFATTLFKICFSRIKKLKPYHFILILGSIFLLYFVMLNVLKAIATDEYNELIRVRLRTSTAASDMRAIFKSSNLLIFCSDYLIMIIRMMFPVELIKLGPKYIIYIVYQVVLSCILIRSVIKYRNLNDAQKISLYLIIGFVMASAAFEPDFGSWIRHEAVTFPIWLILGDLIGRERIND